LLTDASPPVQQSSGTAQDIALLVVVAVIYIYVAFWRHPRPGAVRITRWVDRACVSAYVVFRRLQKSLTASSASNSDNPRPASGKPLVGERSERKNEQAKVEQQTVSLPQEREKQLSAGPQSAKYLNALRRQQEEEKRQERAKRLREIEARDLIGRHADLIDKFLAIAERKVSTLDEYGDENWKSLDREIFRCIEKIAEAEGGSVATWSSPREYRRYDFHIQQRSTERVPDPSDLYRELFAKIETQFRSYHAEHSRRQRATEEIARMTGVEFENYLMQVLKQHGCSVSGTPRTGDSGADIIARLSRRVIVIQAKRSTAPVGNRAVQEVVAARAYYGGTDSWVVTNSTFTQAARELADRNGVRLIGGADLPRIGDFL